MKTLIIDGNNLIHRTYHTAKLQEKRYKGGNPSGLHIYFTINAIYSYVKRFLPGQTYIVWDEKIEYQVNRRREIQKSYKGNRKGDKSPHENNEDIKDICNSLGIKSIFPRELEADDIVAYICRETEGKKAIISVDRDFLQLINEDVTLFDPIRKRYFELANFEKTTGFENVKTWFTAKCLTGDKSDNVPGIPKFGKVKVKKYLDGELQLNESQQSIFELNNKIFRLNLYNDLKHEKKYYKDQLETPQLGDYDEFLKLVEKFNMVNILNNKDHWYDMFFLKRFLNYMYD